MTPDECKTANWYDIGMRDGAKGQSLALLDERAGDCSKAGARADTTRYLAGRELGLRSFCRLDNAIPRAPTYAVTSPKIAPLSYLH